MAPHLTHTGVHDHGFNNVSTYGNLWRLAREGRFEASADEIGGLRARAEGERRGPGRALDTDCQRRLHPLVQRRRIRCSSIPFARCAHRRWRICSVTCWCEEQDVRVNLLDRLLQHARATAEFSVYYGRGRDVYDVRGRVAHESLFNVASGSYRGPSSQQGYSPFTTWTRGLAWAMLGFAEQLEFLDTLAAAEDRFIEAAQATCDYYIELAAADGIPYWDSGAPGLASLGDWGSRPADPLNDVEPVDSSAAAIAAQGLLRFGRYLAHRGEDGSRYVQAGADCPRNAVQRGRPVPEHVARPSGPAAALDLSPPGWLGSRAGRRSCAAR